MQKLPKATTQQASPRLPHSIYGVEQEGPRWLANDSFIHLTEEVTVQQNGATISGWLLALEMVPHPEAPVT